MARRMRGRNLVSPGFIDADAYLRERDRFYDQILGRHPTRRGKGTTGWTPQVDVFEREEEIVVKVDLPGMSKEDIDLSVKGNMLFISGERKERKEGSQEYYCRECAYGRFRRPISLPQSVDTDEIKASYSDGILEVVIPKKEEAKQRRIEVTGE